MFATFFYKSCVNLLLFGKKFSFFILAESIVSAKSVLLLEKFVFLEISRFDVCSRVIRFEPFKIGFTFNGEDIAGSVLISLFYLRFC